MVLQRGDNGEFWIRESQGSRVVMSDCSVVSMLGYTVGWMEFYRA